MTLAIFYFITTCVALDKDLRSDKKLASADKTVASGALGSPSVAVGIGADGSLSLPSALADLREDPDPPAADPTEAPAAEPAAEHPADSGEAPTNDEAALAELEAKAAEEKAAAAAPVIDEAYCTEHGSSAYAPTKCCSEFKVCPTEEAKAAAAATEAKVKAAQETVKVEDAAKAAEEKAAAAAPVIDEAYCTEHGSSPYAPTKCCSEFKMCPTEEAVHLKVEAEAARRLTVAAGVDETGSNAFAGGLLLLFALAH